MGRNRYRNVATVALAAVLSFVMATSSGASSRPLRPSVRLPGDSIEGALHGLAEARAQVDALTGAIARLEVTIASERAQADQLDTERLAERHRRVARAVEAYQRQGRSVPSMSTLTRLLGESTGDQLFAAADDRSRDRIKDLAVRAELLRTHAGELDTELAGDRLSLAAAQATRDMLADKLANAGGAIASIRVPSPVAAAGSSIARRADAAAQRLRALGDAPTWTTDASWLEARHLLTLELAGRAGGDREAVATAMEHEWDTTPRAALVAVLFALRQVGKGYVYATAGPRTFDCSGLVARAYAEAGLGLPHFSASQLHLGAPVRPDALRPGDLLGYGPGSAEHVAMYLGAGLAVEARGVATGVLVDPARRSGSFAGATRILP